jgi:hypothetical protein
MRAHCVVGIMALLAGASFARADLTIWANTGEDKVARDELRATSSPTAVHNSVWDGTTISLFGARNEVIAFNLVLEAGSHAVNGVSVRVDALNGPGGASIVSKAVTGNGVFDWVGRNIELFYIRYLRIRGISAFGYNAYDERHIPWRLRRPWSGQGIAQDGTGWVDRPDHDKELPEIAVPLELVGAFDVASGQNQSIWCDIFIPKGTPAGLYQGQVTVTEGGGATYEIPVQLRVRGFTLPDVPTLGTMVYLGQSAINHRYLGDAWPNDPEPLAASRLITNRHYQLAQRHRISLIGIEGAVVAPPSEEWTPRLDGSLFTPANNYNGPGTGVGLSVFSIGTYGSWASHWGTTQASMQTHADAWETWFGQNHPNVERFVYLIDESTDYAQTQQWASWIESSPGPGRNLMTLATMLIANANLCPAVDIPATVTGVRNTPDVWETAARAYQHRPDKRLYFYNGERPFAGSFSTEDDGVSLRVNAWVQHKIGIHRWFFWESVFWYNGWGGGSFPANATNVFQTAKTIGSTTGYDSIRGETGALYSNGDGVLFYPGTDTMFPVESYNVQGPIGGVRLKCWRRGLQDGDYLALAAAINPTRVQQIVAQMVPKTLWEYGVNDPNDPTWVRTDISWSTDPDVWEAARAELADIIEGNRTGLYTVTPCRVLDTRNATGPLGGPILAADATRSFVMTGTCGIPTDAKAISANVTTVGASAEGSLIAYAGGDPLPLATTISFAAGRARANNALIGLAHDGSGSIAVTTSPASVHLIIDVNGYFR